MFPISDPWFYLAAVPAVLVTGISKGGFGVGLGVLAVPLMALTVPPAQAAGIMLPVLCLMDIFGLWSYRRTWDAGVLQVALPAAFVGIGVGTLSFHLLDDDAIRIIVGGVAVAFALHHWVGVRLWSWLGAGAPPAGARRRSVVRGGFWCAVSGFTSFVAHAGGPPLSVYLVPLRLDKTLFTGTAMVFFAAVNYVKLIPYGWLGQLSSANLDTSLVLAPLAPLSIWLGVWLHGRIAPGVFYRLVYAFVFISGCKLLAEGTGLWDALF